MNLITSIVIGVAITIIILGILVVIYLPLYEDNKLVENWKEEFNRLGDFIRDKEVIDICYKDLTGFDACNRLKVTVRDYQKNTEKIFKIPNTAQLAVIGKRETYPIDVRVKEIKTSDSSHWKIQLSSSEKTDIEHPQHIYKINIFTPASAEQVEYSSR